MSVVIVHHVHVDSCSNNQVENSSSNQIHKDGLFSVIIHGMEKKKMHYHSSRNNQLF